MVLHLGRAVSPSASAAVPLLATMHLIQDLPGRLTGRIPDENVNIVVDEIRVSYENWLGANTDLPLNTQLPTHTFSHNSSDGVRGVAGTTNDICLEPTSGRPIARPQSNRTSSRGKPHRSPPASGSPATTESRTGHTPDAQHPDYVGPTTPVVEEVLGINAQAVTNSDWLSQFVTDVGVGFDFPSLSFEGDHFDQFPSLDEFLELGDLNT